MSFFSLDLNSKCVLMSEARQFETIDSRQLESLRVFHEVARALTSNLDLDAVLRTIVRTMEEFFGPEQWSLLIVDEEAQELYCALAAGASDEEWRSIRIRSMKGLRAVWQPPDSRW